MLREKMWMSELIAENARRQAAGPVQHGHLRVYEGGKVAAGYYVKWVGIWQRLWRRCCRGKNTTVQIHRLEAPRD